MEAQTKYLICSKCRYFPTKMDQQSNKQLEVAPQFIRWICQACQFQNILSRNSFIMLPDRSYLKFPSSSLVSSSIKEKKRLFLVVLLDLNLQLSKKILYTPPADSMALKQSLKLNCCSLLSLKELQSESNWLTFYRKKKLGLMKFCEKKKESNSSIYQDEYLIFLFERYLKKLTASKTANQQNILFEVDILLQANNKVFSFKLENFEITNKQDSLHMFLLIYLLNVLEFKPNWIGRIYQKQIHLHLHKTHQHDQYDKLIVFRQAQNFESQILIHKSPNSSFVKSFLTKIDQHETIAFPEQFFEHFDLYPLNKSSFFQETLCQQQIQVKVVESVDIFCSSRRKKILERITLKQNFQNLKKILIKAQNFKMQSEQQQYRLKNCVMQIIQSLKYKIFLKPVKLIGNFNENGFNYIVLYTFTEKKKVEDSKKGVFLEQPNDYPDYLRDEALGVKSQQVRNPFAKKKKKVEVIQVHPREQENQRNDYISL